MNSLFVAKAAGVALLMAAGICLAQQDLPTSGARNDIRSGQAPAGYEAIAQRYSGNATPELIEMLNDERDAEHWVRVAGVLGTVGDERAVDALIDLIERPVGSGRVLQHWIDVGRSEALRSLGVLVHRTGNQQALEYLIESLDDSIWRQRMVLNVSPPDSYARYDKQLSRYAIYGLAFSGHPRAGDALRSLRESPTPNQARLREGLDDTLDRYLDEVYPLVVQRGIAGMFEHFKQQPEAKRYSPSFR